MCGLTRLVCVVGTGDQYIRRIDPATDTVDLTKLISGSGYYGYSDMTGILARNSNVRLGLWTAIHDSQFTNTAWMRVNWTGADVAGTNLLASGLYPNLAEESWGLDNVKVYLTPRAGPPLLDPILYTPGGFILELRGEPGWNYVIQGSPELITWTGLVTNRPSTNVIQFTDPNAGTRAQRFYRALQLP